MYKKTKMLIAIAVLLFVPLFSVLAANCNNSGNDELSYKDRGNRCEGVHPQNVSSYEIELISAMAYREQAKKLPKFFDLKIKFCLPKRRNDIYVKVRELEYEHFYRMDKPNISLNKGCGNFFEWSNKTVIEKLTGLKISDLGALVRLGNQSSSIEEEVAPVIFYHGSSPNKISEYSFIFETNRDAKFKYFIIDEKAGKEIVPKKKRHLLTKSNKPFKIKWKNASSSRNGFYTLNLEGHFANNGDEIYQSVRFYHRSNIR